MADADTSNAQSTDQGATDQNTPDTTTAEKDPDDWATGGEPMTGPQRSYLETLAREAGEDVPDNLTKAEASELIDRLQSKSPRLDG